MPARAIRLALTVALAVLAALPAAASAGEVTGTDGEYGYSDKAGNETNRLVVTRSGLTTVFTDSAGAVDASAECVQTSTTVVTCTTVVTQRTVDALLAGGDDELDGSASQNVKFVAGGGAGKDRLTGGRERDTLLGDSSDDVLTGNDNDDVLVGGPGDDELRAGADEDKLYGEEGRDDLRGGDNDDTLTGGADADTLSGGANGGFFYSDGCGDRIVYASTTTPLTISLDGVANDDTGDGDTIADDVEAVEGGTAGDRLTGGAGPNCLLGRDGDDVLAGLGGSDLLEGARGGDTLDGGDGSDELRGESVTEQGGGGDVYIGGGDVDLAVFAINACEGGLATCAPRDITVTIDGLANDGADGKGDDVREDVEDVAAITGVQGGAENVGRLTVTGATTFNAISGSHAGDTLDPAGGSDLVYGQGGDDSVETRDGSADRVDCGAGTDAANVDQHDVVIGCETVTRTEVSPDAEDRPPTLTLVTPGPGATLDPSGPTVVRAEAGDDRGVAHVLFLDDDRVLCRDEVAPYECAYQPRAEDVRTNTLTAVAVDTRDQAAFALRTVAVARFRPVRLTLSVRRGVAKGALRLPTALSPAAGCRGTVTVARRKVKLSRTCRFRVRVRARGRAAVRARFSGNAFALPVTSASKRARRA